MTQSTKSTLKYLASVFGLMAVLIVVILFLGENYRADREYSWVKQNIVSHQWTWVKEANLKQMLKNLFEQAQVPGSEVRMKWDSDGYVYIETPDNTTWIGYHHFRINDVELIPENRRAYEGVLVYWKGLSKPFFEQPDLIPKAITFDAQ